MIRGRLLMLTWCAASIVAIAVVRAQSSECDPIITSVEPSSGPTSGGTTVKVTGSTLLGCCIASPCLSGGVYFGDAPAQVIGVTTDSLIVVAPPHQAGPVEITVVGYFGRGVLRGGFTYIGDVPLFTSAVFCVLAGVLAMIGAIRLRFGGA